MSDEAVPVVRVTLPDGSQLDAFEAEIDMVWEGRPYLQREVPYLSAVHWPHPHYASLLPLKSVRLFAVLIEEPGVVQASKADAPRRAGGTMEPTEQGGD